MKSKFFCDVIGTFDGGENRQEEINRFVNNIIQLDSSDVIEFSFVSSDEYQYIKPYIDEIKKAIEGTKIVLGIQYCGSHAIYNDIKFETVNTKVDQIIENINMEPCDAVYYADDSNLNLKIALLNLEQRFPNLMTVMFYSSQYGKGIESLNSCVESYLCEKNAFLM